MVCCSEYDVSGCRSVIPCRLVSSTLPHNRLLHTLLCLLDYILDYLCWPQYKITTIFNVHPLLQQWQQCTTNVNQYFYTTLWSPMFVQTHLCTFITPVSPLYYPSHQIPLAHRLHNHRFTWWVLPCSFLSRRRTCRRQACRCLWRQPPLVTQPFRPPPRRRCSSKQRSCPPCVLLVSLHAHAQHIVQCLGGRWR